MKFITSDTHFFHKNILKFNPRTRQYSSPEEMNEKMILDWNSRVAPFTDTVYILGDVCFGSAEKAVGILSRLNGRKILIRGNHDVKLVKDKAFRDQFEEIHDYLEVTHDGVLLCMMHFPIEEWASCHRGSVMLHGHCHGNLPQSEFRKVDVGVDGFCDGKSVVSLDSVVQFAMTKKIRARAHGDSAENM